MMPKNSIENYKEAIRKNGGKEINLCIKKGRKILVINNCIIENAYDSIFVVKICGESFIKAKRLSVCYADLLTGNARVTVQSQIKPA